MKHFWQKTGALCDLAGIYFSPVHSGTMESLQRCIRHRFPGVRQLRTRELAEWMAADAETRHPLLLDVRSKEEFEVSHLSGSHRFVSVEQVRNDLLDAAQSIVVYCSVGYRSSAVAEKLRAAGLNNVWNLEGSLFQWVNEGRQVHRGTELLRPARVYPYNRKWGQLLKPEYRATLP